MKRRVGGHRPRTYLAVAGAASLMPAAHPAHAAPAPPPVEFSYSAPRSNQYGDRISWTWTIRNRTSRPVQRVTLTHTLTPKVRIASITAPCVIVQGGAVECDYRTLRPGERRRGTLVAVVPSHLQSKVRISGHATWRRTPGSAGPKGVTLPNLNQPRPGLPTPHRDILATH